ncbi:hypothetical protein N9Y89_01645 [bacterium]|nr:hypothetical protein [bacterium]
MILFLTQDNKIYKYDEQSNSLEIDAIKKEVNPKDNLEFCELNLLNDDGWDDAMKGCDFVMHVASPFINIEPKDENEYIRPGINSLNFQKLKAFPIPTQGILEISLPSNGKSYSYSLYSISEKTSLNAALPSLS